MAELVTEDTPSSTQPTGRRSKREDVLGMFHVSWYAYVYARVCVCACLSLSLYK